MMDCGGKRVIQRDREDKNLGHGSVPVMCLEELVRRQLGLAAL
jgi:hypothetical protein